MRVLAAALCLFLPVMALAIDLPASEPVPGGVAVVPLPYSGKTAPKAKLDGKPVMVVMHAAQWFALVGIALETSPGELSLDVSQGGGVQQVKFDVAPKQYPLQALTITNPEMVNPTPAQLRRIEREQLHLDKVVNRWHKTSRPGIAFIWPGKGPETSPFGVHRVLNGEPRSPHTGVDLGAPAGTPVHAPANAVVADVGRYYFCGKTLTLDMGEGLYSIYCHLSRITVRPGQRVKQGQLVGRVGATGRTTGPNLHWTVKLNGVAVDPAVFLGANTPPAPVLPMAVAAQAAPAAATRPVAAAVTSAAPAAITHK
ncbi:MAG TPA: peptidoglycan DD-metalloendopeptidase family protein [Gammaproteobacteria bacterium]|nr:peptidoglycan DD-metalloendopeptidase family protein [Gammaproteobacteria bacterium]